MTSKKTQPKTKTPAQVRAELVANGVNISEWARDHGFNRYTVVDLLRGKRIGRRGAPRRCCPRPQVRAAGRLTLYPNPGAPKMPQVNILTLDSLIAIGTRANGKCTIDRAQALAILRDHPEFKFCPHCGGALTKEEKQ